MDRHKIKLQSFLEKQVKILQKKILDLSEVVLPSDNYKPFRSKILSATNDMLRDLQAEIDKNYNINYNPSIIHEDIVVIQPSKFDYSYKGKERKERYGK